MLSVEATSHNRGVFVVSYIRCYRASWTSSSTSRPTKSCRMRQRIIPFGIFFQARSWLDYAKRASSPSAIHYAAFELRYGIEYLLLSCWYWQANQDRKSV